ncbi:MAG: TrkA family potassium uptake protein [Rhodospirillales bacterium]|nr:TrkA family potassium uptake protein [Rhodospirillales bacterium]
MRIVLVGAGPVATGTASLLMQWGHEVVIIDRDKERIEQLAETLDCGFLIGDGSNPAVLRDAGPEQADYLLCLTDSDQDNILASIVGRSLGFKHVVPKIENEEYEHVCMEIGLEHTIIPDRTIARNLADMIEGHSIIEMSTMIRGDVRFFSHLVTPDDGKTVGDIDYPKNTRAICIYRGDDFLIPHDETTIHAGDEVIVITERRAIPALTERWGKRKKDNSD